MELVTDANYNEFKNSQRAALLVSTNRCQKCKEYLPIVERVSGLMPFIRFGKVVLDEGRSIQLKREYPDVTSFYPSMVFFKEQKRVGKINGIKTDTELVSKVQEYLLLSTRIFIPSSNGVYIPASIQQINGIKGPYLVRCEEDSSLGKKRTIIRIPEKEINWGLETKV